MKATVEWVEFTHPKRVEAGSDSEYLCVAKARLTTLIVQNINIKSRNLWQELHKPILWDRLTSRHKIVITGRGAPIVGEHFAGRLQV